MRLIQRRALIVAVAVALVSSLAVLPTVASAAKHKSTPIQKLSKRVTAISKSLNVVANNLKNVTGTVNQGIPIITQLVSGLQKASDGLTALQTGLNTVVGNLTTLAGSVTTLAGKVSDTGTGLPGLNTARPLVGQVLVTTLECTAAYGTAKTGPCAAPGSEFTLVGNAATGEYVLHFVRSDCPTGCDVHARAIEVTPLNAVAFVSGDNCSVDPRCTAAAGSADTSVNDVLVGTANSTGTAINSADFSVAAISG